MTAPPPELIWDNNEKLCLPGYQEIPLGSSCAACFPQSFVLVMINYRLFLILFVHKHTRQSESLWYNWFIITVPKGTIHLSGEKKNQQKTNSSHLHYKVNPRSREWRWDRKQNGKWEWSDIYRRRHAQDTHERVILLVKSYYVHCLTK